MTGAARTRTSQFRTNGVQIRILRYSNGWTIDQVIDRLNQHHNIKIHPDHLRKIEHGTRNGSPKVLHALARIYGTEVSDLLKVTP